MPIGTKPFRVELVTPERAEPAGECTFAALPAWDGEVGLLAGRAPLVCKLGAGEMRVEAGGKIRRYYVQGGFAEMLDDVLTVLTDRAIAATELSAVQAEAELAEARQMKADDELSAQIRRERVAQARARLRVARRSGG